MKFNATSGGNSDPNVIKLKDGQSVTGVLRGEPVEFEKAFKPGDTPKFRFKINMVLNQDGKLVAKVLQGGWKLYAQLSDLQNAGWKLEESFVMIARRGSQMNDTVYSATASPNKPTADQLGAISRVQLNVLTADQPARQSREPGQDDDSGNFGPY